MNHHVFTIFVEHNPGVLARIAGLFGRRGFNIESALATPTSVPNIYRIIVVAPSSETEAHQINKQLTKLVEVIEVVDEVKCEEVSSLEHLMQATQRIPFGKEFTCQQQ